MNAAVADAYGAGRDAWERGPMRVYAAVADALCDLIGVPLAGALVLDVGSGTGAATEALRRRGAHVVPLDVAVGMRPAVAADARRLPFAADSFDALVAAFSLNHVDDPAVALAEARRVLRTGGAALVAVYAEVDAHPVKDAVDAAAAAAGWSMPDWYARLRATALPRLATVERAEAVARAAGLPSPSVELVEAPVPGLDVAGLVAWRTGMPHLAPFFASLSPSAQARVLADVFARLADDVPPLVRSVVVLRWREADPQTSRAASAASASGLGDALATRAAISSA